MAKMCTVSRLERQFATLCLFHAPTPRIPESRFRYQYRPEGIFRFFFGLMHMLLQRNKANSLVPASFSPLHGLFRERGGLVLVYVFLSPPKNMFLIFFSLFSGCLSAKPGGKTCDLHIAIEITAIFQRIRLFWWDANPTGLHVL